MSTSNLPEYLSQGEIARLFPVLSNTSKEGRTTCVTLACISRIYELGRVLLASAGQKVGIRAKVDAYTEIVPTNLANDMKERPDGLIVLTVGKRVWKAFVEAKVGNSDLDSEQVERYRVLAKENGVDYLITISNQFATAPSVHPLECVRKSRSRIPVIHWSWMYILTEVELLFHQADLVSPDQRLLLNELRRFLAHESAGVRGFTRMPREWTDLNRLISSGGDIRQKSTEAVEVIHAWHQETRDLSLIFSRLTETGVMVKLPRKHVKDLSQRVKFELSYLQRERQLRVLLDIPDAAAPLEVVADLTRRCIDVGMSLRAPEDKKTTGARINWLLRQIKHDDLSNLYIRVHWQRRSETTQYLVADLRRDLSIAVNHPSNVTPVSFDLFYSKHLGARFVQQTNFIDDLEKLVPAFYALYGSKLVAWKKSAPTISSENAEPDDVSRGAISEDADTDALDT